MVSSGVLPDIEDPDLVAIVAAKEAWPLYRAVGAYITHNRRAIRPTRHLGFYARRTIYPAFPLILSRHDDVDITEATAARLLLDVDPDQQQLGAIVKGAVDYGWGQQLLSVFVLTSYEDPRTVQRPEIPHHLPNAFTQGQRYASLQRLLAARTTEDVL